MYKILKSLSSLSHYSFTSKILKQTYFLTQFNYGFISYPQRYQGQYFQTLEEVESVKLISSEEFKALLNSLNTDNISNTPKVVGTIVEFMMKNNLGFNEQMLNENNDFFQVLKFKVIELIDHLDQNKQIDSQDICNLINYSYVLQILDQDRLQKLLNYYINDIDNNHDNKEILSLINILQKDDFQVDNEVKRDKQITLLNKVINDIENKGFKNEQMRILVHTFILASKVLDYEELTDFYSSFDEEVAIMIDQISSEEFANLCGAIANQNQQYIQQPHKMIKLEYLLEEALNLTKSHINVFPNQDFILVYSAYAYQLQFEENQELLQLFEKEIKLRLFNFSQEEISYLLNVATEANIPQTEVFMLVDRYIGKNVQEIEPRLIYGILLPFYNSGHARPKLFLKLQGKIIENVERIEINDLAAILRLYTEMQIQSSTLYEIISEYMSKHLNQLDMSGFMNALIGFKNSQTQKKFSITSDLERILVANINNLDLETLAQLLFNYTQTQQKAPKIQQLIHNQTINELRSLKEQDAMIDPSNLIYLTHAFVRLDASSDDFKLFSDHVSKGVEHFSDEDLKIMSDVMSSLSAKHEGFEQARNACQNEIIHRRNSYSEI